jgi:cellulose synthase/poly-beta-1,6-N-acetylglucosamine synthase-like glycosyltransferase
MAINPQGVWYLVALANSLVISAAAFVFIIYPRLWIHLRRQGGTTHAVDLDAQPSVTLFVSARNEERVIRRKLENCLALEYPPQRLEVHVLSDASEDATVAIAREIQSRDPRIKVTHSDAWRGKNALLMEGIAASRADVLVFTDANAMLSATALGQLVKPFADPAVGCVTGNLVLEEQGGSSAEEAETYWNLERAIKEAESTRGWVVASNGALLACRRSTMPTLTADTANDFLIPLSVIAAGKRSVFSSAATAFEPSTRDLGEEQARKERIIIRGMTCVSRLLTSLPTPVRAHLLIRKVFRWIAIPMLCLTWAGSAAALLAHGQWAAGLFFLALATWPWTSRPLWLLAPKRLGALGAYAAMLGRASTKATLRFLRGARVSSWTSPQSDRL